MDLVTGRLTFRRFRDLMASMPGDGTAMWRKARREKPEGGKRSVEPPDDWWTPERDLLATVADGINVLAWLQTKDAQTGRNRPKPIPRPGTRGPNVARQRMAPSAAAALLTKVSGIPLAHTSN